MTPGVYKPQLAMLTKELLDGEQWLRELKYDGCRIGYPSAAQTCKACSRRVGVREHFRWPALF